MSSPCSTRVGGESAEWCRPGARGGFKLEAAMSAMDKVAQPQEVFNESTAETSSSSQRSFVHYVDLKVPSSDGGGGVLMRVGPRGCCLCCKVFSRRTAARVVLPGQNRSPVAARQRCCGGEERRVVASGDQWQATVMKDHSMSVLDVDWAPRRPSMHIASASFDCTVLLWASSPS